MFFFLTRKDEASTSLARMDFAISSTRAGRGGALATLRLRRYPRPMEYPHQIDCAWLAFDNSECVLAAMITAGCGPIPGEALSHPIDVADIESMLLDLPSIGEARLKIDVPNPASFIALSERGLFVYDWTDVHRASTRINAYELVATPTVPLCLERLPGDLRVAAVRLAATQGIGDGTLTIR